MPTDDDAFWDELGVSWRASIRDAGLISSRLEAHVRLQSALLTAGTLAGAAVSLLGFGLAAWTLWIGWSSQTWHFLTRGATLATVSLLAGIATLALRARSGVETRSLKEMLQVSIAQTERLIRAADLGCYSLVILAFGGTVGYALRIWLGRPPRCLRSKISWPWPSQGWRFFGTAGARHPPKEIQASQPSFRLKG